MFVQVPICPQVVTVMHINQANSLSFSLHKYICTLSELQGPEAPQAEHFTLYNGQQAANEFALISGRQKHHLTILMLSHHVCDFAVRTTEY